jgi:hypothetical protein
MERTTDFHHEIADALLPQADPAFDDATAFDTTVDMLNAQSARFCRKFSFAVIYGMLSLYNLQ